MNNPKDGSFTVSIAGLGIVLDCRDPVVLTCLYERYASFVNEETGILNIYISHSNQEIERSNNRLEPIFQEGVLYFHSPDYDGMIDIVHGEARLAVPQLRAVDDADYFIRVATTLLAFHVGGMMLHGAGVIRKGKAYIFFGHSGSGKTTVARLSPNDRVINDDLIIVMPHKAETAEGLTWDAHGTPFWNPDQVRPTQAAAQIYGIYHLMKDKQVFLERLESGRAMAELISNIPIIPLDPDSNRFLLDRVSSLVEVIPVYNLHFLPDDSFWPVIEGVL